MDTDRVFGIAMIVGGAYFTIGYLLCRWAVRRWEKRQGRMLATLAAERRRPAPTGPTRLLSTLQSSEAVIPPRRLRDPEFPSTTPPTEGDQHDDR